jgi:hypothetical protein
LGVWGIFLYGPAGSYFYRLNRLQILKELAWALKSYLAFTAIIYFVEISFPVPMVLCFCAADACFGGSAVTAPGALTTMF